MKNSDKVLLAKEFYDNAKLKKLSLLDDSIKNIKSLLKYLGLLS